MCHCESISYGALVLGRVLIGFYFFFFTFWNFYHRKDALGIIKTLKLPLAEPLAPFIFALGLCIQCVTGILIMIGQYTLISASILVVFAFSATFIYHRFWSMDWGPARTLNTIIFIGNVTITFAALLFVIATAGL